MKTLFDQSIFALNTSSFLYLGACFAFVISISRASPEKIAKWSRWASYLVWAAFVLHTFGLGARWYLGGISRPPWTNLYESLIAFAWGVVAFQVYAIHKWKLPILGVIASPLVYILMGMSVMTPNKSVEPLIPALQSNWIKIHVAFGIIAYAGFTVSACLSFLYLMRRGISLSKIGAGLSLILLLNLSIAGGQEVFTTGEFYMAKTVTRTMPDGRQIQTKDTYQQYEGGPMITRMEKVPYAAIPFWLTWGLFLASAVAFWKTRRRENETFADSGEEISSEDACRKGHDVSRVAQGIYGAGLVCFVCLFANVGWAKNLSPTLSLSSNPYLMILLLMSFFLAIVFFIIQYRYSSFLKSLPSAGRIDELSYKNILFGFPFQSLLLVTGAIWAYSAWGRSWGWDPKETWALITWFAYLIYLHGRLLFRWSGSLLSIISIVGFVIMIFAFLGVNLVLSGLHSYGSA
jgi:ABC-type transport system involved in cytochrome c biogenesis permease subunit